MNGIWSRKMNPFPDADHSFRDVRYFNQPDRHRSVHLPFILSLTAYAIRLKRIVKQTINVSSADCCLAA